MVNCVVVRAGAEAREGAEEEGAGGETFVIDSPELPAAAGHTGDGMAVGIPWAEVLVAGDYLSLLELPSLGEGGDLTAYLATLERLRALVGEVERVVPGHGPVLERDRALEVLAQ